MRICKPIFFSLTVLGAAASSHANENGPHKAFFADVKAGRAVVQLPAGMADPADLSRRFNSEPRVIDWAVKVEKDIGRALARAGGKAIKWSKITCNRSSCEVMAVAATPTAKLQDALYNDVQRQLQSAALMHDKEMMLAIGGDVPNEVAIIGYFYSEKD